MRYQEFKEARRRPELNPRVSLNSLLAQRLKQTTDMITDGMPNLFVSFTTVDKLGINPRSGFNTPLGIYSYPAKFVADQMGAGRPAKVSVPFAGDSPYANIFGARGRIIDLARMSDSDLQGYVKGLVDIWAEAGGGDSAAEDVAEIVKQAPREALHPRYPGGKFWYMTREVAMLMNPDAEEGDVSFPATWNKIFRRLGIDGVVDPGVGIVHHNERHQGVFFSIGAVEGVERVQNKYSPDEQAAARSQGQDQKAWAERLYAAIKGLDSEGIANYVLDSEEPERAFALIRDPQARLLILKERPTAARLAPKTSDAEQQLILQRAPKADIRDFREANFLKVVDRINRDAASPTSGFFSYGKLGDDVDWVYSHRLSPEGQLALIRKDPGYLIRDPNPTREKVQAALQAHRPVPKEVAALAAEFKLQPQP